MVAVHAGPLPGSIERIAALHAGYYAAHAGFGAPFEARVARELAAFHDEFQASRDGLWLLRQGDGIEGSVAIDGSHAESSGARLRWFILSDALRGQGWGNNLLATALAFCRDHGYAMVHLDTFRGLDAARHLYEKYGFRLVQERPGTQWGKEVAEQRFEANLAESGSRGRSGAQ